MIDFSTVKSVIIPEGKVKQISKDGVVLWKGGYKNLVPTATDLDGSIYNGVGYKAKQRINSSGSVVAYDYCTLTGLMPCDGLVGTTRIYVKGLTFNTDDYYNGVALCDASGNVMCSFRSFPNATTVDKVSLYCNNVPNVIQTTGTSVTLANGISTIIVNVNEDYDAYKSVKQFRLYGQPTGEEIIVTVDEKIT